MENYTYLRGGQTPKTEKVKVTWFSTGGGLTPKKIKHISLSHLYITLV